MPAARKIRVASRKGKEREVVKKEDANSTLNDQNSALEESNRACPVSDAVTSVSAPIPSGSGPAPSGSNPAPSVYKLANLKLTIGKRQPSWQGAGERTNSVISGPNSALEESNRISPPVKKQRILLRTTSSRRGPVEHDRFADFIVDQLDATLLKSKSSVDSSTADSTLEESNTAPPPAKKQRISLRTTSSRCGPVEQRKNVDSIVDQLNATTFIKFNSPVDSPVADSALEKANTAPAADSALKNSNTAPPPAKSQRISPRATPRSKNEAVEHGENINSIVDHPNGTVTKSNPSVDSPAAKTGEVSGRTARMLRRGGSNPEEDVKFATHSPGDALNKSDLGSLYWKITHYFSEDQIDFLVSMLRKIPREVTIKSYIHQLRESIMSKESQSEWQKVSGDRFVDSGKYWKDEYEKEHERVEQLESLVVRLQRRFESGPMIPQKASTAGSDEDEIPSGHHNSARHASRDRSMNTIPADNNEMRTHVLEDNDDQTMIFALLSQVTEKRQSLCETENTSMLQTNGTPTLCLELMGLTRAAIYKCNRKFLHVRKGNGNNKATKFLLYLVNEIAESYKNCVDTITEQYKTIAGRETISKSGLTLSLCFFFRWVLDRIADLCTANAKVPNNSSQSAPQQVETSTEDNEPILIGLLSNLLLDILLRVDWKQSNGFHKQVFDGVLSIILEKVGQLMSVTLFGECVTDSTKPGNITFRKVSKQRSLTEFRWVSKYLIRLLRVVLKVQKEKNMGGPTEELVKASYKKIRNTLINGMIGTKLSGLAIPKIVAEEPLDVPELKSLDTYGPEWTIQSVYLLVGIVDDEDEVEHGVEVQQAAQHGAEVQHEVEAQHEVQQAVQHGVEVQHEVQQAARQHGVEAQHKV
ncbi:hypothetical protein DSL72_009477 [Monilinia vaccinii-corymbosi]|uniref:Uncharacterized protein n=1 Tax=Monilinia vaccinii-corymbosi TaxID=61207 RepID=A0A8A3PR77_9HELO|nr:hypothetical protein DSL72_009477 [Monilinia vaccinii-corymbosi]